jgi:tripartite-type tricarboxylate transporter receptor subunit TctC
MKSIVAIAAGLLVAGAALAQTPPPYYAGKTLTIISGYAAGGGYTAYARVIGKYLGRHIPGAPSVIVREMPGGASIVAVNYIYNVAKPDGLTLGAVNMFNMYSNYMAKTEAVRYELRDMEFIGNARSGNAIFLMRSDRYPTLDAIRAAMKAGTAPIHLGHAGRGDGHHILGVAMEKGLGVNFHHVFGYRGGGGIDLALERGELDGRAANLNSYLISKPDWINNGFVSILAQEGMLKDGQMTRDTRIANVPTIHELFPNNKTVEQLMDYVSVSDILSGIYIAPPRTPPELLAILRTGFLETLSDPDLLAEAQRYSLDITPMSAGEVLRIVEHALNVSPDVVKLATDLTRSQ